MSKFVTRGAGSGRPGSKATTGSGRIATRTRARCGSARSCGRPCARACMCRCASADSIHPQQLVTYATLSDALFRAPRT